MRYLSLLAAILASTPVCAAEFTNTLEMPPGFTERWQAPRPFTSVTIGTPGVVDAKAETDQTLTISKEKKGNTNIVLLDAHGDQVANVLVTDPPGEPPNVARAAHPTIQYQVVRSAVTGAWQVYQKEDECYPVCVRIETKPNDPAPTPSIVVPNASKEIASQDNDVVIPLNKSKTFRLDQPFSTAVVGSPEIADALLMGDHSVYIRGKKIGTTDVSVFDDSMQLVGVLDVQIAP
jgi:Flp pilus assembly secretin CpaC